MAVQANISRADLPCEQTRLTIGDPDEDAFSKSRREGRREGGVKGGRGVEGRREV